MKPDGTSSNMFDANSYPKRRSHSMPAIADERTLVELAIGGDAEAYGDLYERYMYLVYRHIYYRVGDIKLAEDLTETVFLKVWENLSRFEPTRISFKGWLFRVAHNLLVDYYRTLKQSQSIDDGFELPDPRLSPEDQIIITEQEEVLLKAIKELKQEYQNILTLRFINGLSHAETADILGRSIGAVRVLQHRALKALGDQIEALKGNRGG
jgi:RNA polymerase sigma-70 factor (ECF subfamily)